MLSELSDSKLNIILVPKASPIHAFDLLIAASWIHEFLPYWPDFFKKIYRSIPFQLNYQNDKHWNREFDYGFSEKSKKVISV